MLQKEVVERLAATPGGGDWGRLSIMVQYHCRVEHLFNVGPGAFNPPPKVDSAIVRLTPSPSRPIRHATRNCSNGWSRGLQPAPQTLRNTLKPLLSVEDIEAAEVDPTLRPEQLDLAAFVRLANRLAELPGNR